MMEILFLVGRITLGAYYLYNGVNHSRNYGTMVQAAKSRGVPLAGLALRITGPMLLLGGLSLLLGVYPVVGVALVVLFLIPVAFWMHRFWGVDPQTARTQRPQFLKNVALVASALMFLAIPTPWPFSLGG